jgi:hypothetical protein
MNRIETGLDSVDSRGAALESGIAQPVIVPYSSSIAIDATQGALFYVVATGDLALADITGGTAGQLIEVWVGAAAADRVLTAFGIAISVPQDIWWMGRFRYVNFSASPNDLWALTDELTFISPSSIGSGSLSSGAYLSSYPGSY